MCCRECSTCQAGKTSSPKGSFVKVVLKEKRKRPVHLLHFPEKIKLGPTTNYILGRAGLGFLSRKFALALERKLLTGYNGNAKV